MSFITGLPCKACSLDLLDHEWQRRSTDALNNNLRPKSDYHGSGKINDRHQEHQPRGIISNGKDSIIPVICSSSEEEFDEDLLISSDESK